MSEPTTTAPAGARLETRADTEKLRTALDSATVEDAFGDARSPQETVALLCGITREVVEPGAADGAAKLYRTVVIREMTGVEEDIVVDSTMPSDVKLDTLLANCISAFVAEDGEKIADRAEIAKIVRSELPTVDRTYLVLRLRILSLGHQFPFKAHCASCNTAVNKTVDLRDLETRPALTPAKRVFEVELPSGRKARWRIPTGVDESVLAKRVAATGGRDLMTRVLEMRVFEVDGQPGTFQAIRALSTRDRDALRGDIDAQEGHLDTAVDVVCDSCSNKFEATVGIAGPSFFFPTLR